MFLDPEHPNHEELYVDQSSPRGTAWTSISTSKLDVVVDIDALIELSAKIPGCTPGSTKLSVLKKICLEAERRADVQGNITVESVIHANQTCLAGLLAIPTTHLLDRCQYHVVKTRPLSPPGILGIIQVWCRVHPSAE